MDKWITNVPVVVNIWINPDNQKEQFEVIKKAKPSQMFLVSDMGRDNEEKQRVISNRKYVLENIDWQCEVHKLFMDDNVGIYKMLPKVEEFVFSTVDRCIYLEDDIIPNVSFFTYSAELLEKYKDDERVGVICGHNHLGEYDCGESDYFFSRHGSIWGIALWKRTLSNKEKLMSLKEYEKQLVLKRLKHDGIVRKEFFDVLSGKKCPDWEYYIMMNVYAMNQLQIIPKKNMICCKGASASSHSADSLERLPRGVQQVFNMKTYELPDAIIHPSVIINDVCYEKIRNRIMGYNHPFITYYRMVERAFRCMIKGDMGYVYKKMKINIKKFF